MDGYNEDFWKALDELVNSSEIVIDRPRGSAHPRFPNFIYKVDYGYLKDTASMDGAGIDVWVGSGEKKFDEERFRNQNTDRLYGRRKAGDIQNA